jgi:hypothetical protein
MPHKKFILAYYTGPLGCLINTQKAFGILLVHKIQDSRLQLFLLIWATALAVLLGAGISGFSLMPVFLALVLFSAIFSLCALLFWLGSENLFLKFVLEDEAFYNLATQSHALSVLEDTDAWPQPTKKTFVRKRAVSPLNFRSPLAPQEGPANHR